MMPVAHPWHGGGNGSPRARFVKLENKNNGGDKKVASIKDGLSRGFHYSTVVVVVVGGGPFHGATLYRLKKQDDHHCWFGIGLTVVTTGTLNPRLSSFFA